MRMTTQLNKRDNAIQMLKHHYSVALTEGTPSEKFHGRIKMVFELLREEKVPLRMINWIQGYARCMWDNFLRNELIFVYKIDGQLYAAHNQDAREDLPKLPDELLQRTVKNSELGHLYYRHLLKPF